MNRRKLFSFLAAAPLGAVAVAKELAAEPVAAPVVETALPTVTEVSFEVKPLLGELRAAWVTYPVHEHLGHWSPVHNGPAGVVGVAQIEIWDGEKWVKRDSIEGIDVANKAIHLTRTAIVDAMGRNYPPLVLYKDGNVYKF